MNARRLSRRQRGNLAEFSLALFILLLFIALPLINLVALGMGAASASAFTHQAATVAATQRRYSDALNAMQSESRSFNNMGLCSFIKMKPAGGYQGCGSDLFINAENYRSPGAGAQTFGPNTPVPPPVDVSTYEYEYTVQLHYQQSPFLNLAAVPFIGSVPGVGKPVQLTFSASRAAEYPAGLEGDGGTLASAAAPTIFNSTPSPDTVPPSQLGSSLSGWNYPNIYTMIASAGQSVVSNEVVEVDAMQPIPPKAIIDGYTPTGVTLLPGQNVWIDSRADGLWNAWAGTLYNANGSPSQPGGTGTPNVDEPLPSAPGDALIGMIGNNTPFVVGVDILNYVPGQQTGSFGLIINDTWVSTGFTDNVGMQTVRVIVTQ